MLIVVSIIVVSSPIHIEGVVQTPISGRTYESGLNTENDFINLNSVGWRKLIMFSAYGCAKLDSRSYTYGDSLICAASENQGVFYLPSTKLMAMINCVPMTSAENILPLDPIEVEQTPIFIPIHIGGLFRGMSDTRGIICQPGVRKVGKDVCREMNRLQKFLATDPSKCQIHSYTNRRNDWHQWKALRF